jgi:hypothetical protein
MTVQELENKVWEQDGIRIIVRDRSNAKVKEYKHKNAAQEKWSIIKFLSNRINPLVRDKEVVVLYGNGEMPHGGTLLKTIRQSYN